MSEEPIFTDREPWMLLKRLDQQLPIPQNDAAVWESDTTNLACKRLGKS